MVDLLAKMPARVAGALLIGLTVLAMGSLGWGLYTYVQHRDDVAEASVRFDERLCDALPSVAAAGAKALQDVVVEANRAEGVPEARIKRTLALGAVLISRARTEAINALPECAALRGGIP